MSDVNLDDDHVKLIGYTIVYLKRGQERIVEGGVGNVLIVERMTERAFIGFVITSWAKEFHHDDSLIDAKYLDVDYNVIRRWPRRELGFAEKQIKQLNLIADALADNNKIPGARVTPRNPR